MVPESQVTHALVRASMIIKLLVMGEERKALLTNGQLELADEVLAELSSTFDKIMLEGIEVRKGLVTPGLHPQTNSSADSVVKMMHLRHAVNCNISEKLSDVCSCGLDEFILRGECMK